MMTFLWFKYNGGNSGLVPVEVNTESSDTLSILQNCVEGLIEPIFTIPSPYRHFDLTAYVNEEGLLMSLPMLSMVETEYVRQRIAGQIVITALDRDGNTAGLTEAEIEFIKELWDGVTLHIGSDDGEVIS